MAVTTLLAIIVFETTGPFAPSVRLESRKRLKTEIEKRETEREREKKKKESSYYNNEIKVKLN